MNRIDLPHLLWALESIENGEIINQIKVEQDVAQQAISALDKMLEHAWKYQKNKMFNEIPSCWLEQKRRLQWGSSDIVETPQWNEEAQGRPTESEAFWENQQRCLSK